MESVGEMSQAALTIWQKTIVSICFNWFFYKKIDLNHRKYSPTFTLDGSISAIFATVKTLFAFFVYKRIIGASKIF
jgi:hypothetical protein